MLLMHYLKTLDKVLILKNKLMLQYLKVKLQKILNQLEKDQKDAEYKRTNR